MFALSILLLLPTLFNTFVCQETHGNVIRPSMASLALDGTHETIESAVYQRAHTTPPNIETWFRPATTSTGLCGFARLRPECKHISISAHQFYYYSIQGFQVGQQEKKSFHFGRKLTRQKPLT
jgi:hypothetical protein